MNIKRLSKKQIALLGVGLIILGLLANPTVLSALFSSDGQLASRSIVIIYLFDATLIGIGLILVIFRSFSALLEAAVGLLIFVGLIFVAEKVFYRLNHPPPTPNAVSAPAPATPYQTGSYTEGFFDSDDLLGYIPQPNRQVESIKQTETEIIYDATYTIDEYSRRKTPLNPAGRDKFAIFFGGSFVFGEGLNDDETLPYQFGKLASKYQPYNYGLSGYGPQQMLAKLESGQLPSEVTQNDGIAIYVFIDGHVERALGSTYVFNAWGDRMPHYATDWQGNLVRRGDFRDGRPMRTALYELLNRSEIASYFKISIPPRLTERHYAFTAKMIAAARDSFGKQYNPDNFYVLIYPDEGDYFEDLQPHFEAYDLNILNYDERIKLNPDEGLAIAGDGHPTGKANEIVAGWIAEDLEIRK